MMKQVTKKIKALVDRLSLSVGCENGPERDLRDNFVLNNNCNLSKQYRT